jgi:DNA-binding NtrC family response regulator
VIARMPGVIQPLLNALPESVAATKRRHAPASRVVAVSSDTAFFAAVLGAVEHAEWQIEWARSFRRAMEICTRKTIPVVIYDSHLPGIEWEWAFTCLAAVPDAPRLLLAANSVDEDLWRDVLRRRGYDVVERSAGSAALRRALQFVRLSLAPSNESKFRPDDPR